MEQIIKSVDLDYNALADCTQKLCDTYSFLSAGSIGKSAVGRDIISLSLGSGRAVLFAAAFHGCESITGSVVLRFVERLCRAASDGRDIAGFDARQILRTRQLVVIPRVNPDGCEIALHGADTAGAFADKVRRIAGGYPERWDANARGVDINHNFDAGWQRLRKLEQDAGIHGPSARKYGGMRPHSEPETAALVTLCEQISFGISAAFHSQGEVIYWSYGVNTPPRSRRLANLFAASSGYALEQPSGLASHGGFKDWVIDKLHRPAFTVELGRGTNPLPAAQLDSIYDRVEEMLALMCIL